jgi:hypothetical protein
MRRIYKFLEDLIYIFATVGMLVAKDCLVFADANFILKVFWRAFGCACERRMSNLSLLSGFSLN